MFWKKKNTYEELVRQREEIEARNKQLRQRAQVLNEIQKLKQERKNLNPSRLNQVRKSKVVKNVRKNLPVLAKKLGRMGKNTPALNALILGQPLPQKEKKNTPTQKKNTPKRIIINL